ncbi:hypothetical protein SK36_02212 [Citrobacter sp. MGH106]|nr:hypothetical protein SK36_02212 [Citrobacter sp. MGH106]
MNPSNRVVVGRTGCKSSLGHQFNRNAITNIDEIGLKPRIRFTAVFFVNLSTKKSAPEMSLSLEILCPQCHMGNLHREPPLVLFIIIHSVLTGH